MVIIATSQYSILRGSTINSFGDEVDGSTAVYTGVRGLITQKSKSIYNPDSGRVQTVVYYIGRFPYGTDIVQGDRILDERAGKTFVVNSANPGSDFVNKSDLILDLEIN